MNIIVWCIINWGPIRANCFFHKLGHQAFGGSGRLLLVAGLLIRERLPSENFGWKIPTPDLKKNAKIERGCPDTGLHQNGAPGQETDLDSCNPFTSQAGVRDRGLGLFAMQKFEQGAPATAVANRDQRIVFAQFDSKLNVFHVLL